MANNICELLNQMEKTEKEICNFSLVFTEMFKDEINAHDENNVYIGFKKVMKKYAKDEKGIKAISDFFDAITGGASLDEIMTIAIEEAQDPSAAAELTVDSACKVEE